MRGVGGVYENTGTDGTFPFSSSSASSSSWRSVSTQPLKVDFFETGTSASLPLDDDEDDPPSSRKAGAFSSLRGTGDLGGECVLFLRILSSKSLGRVVLDPGGVGRRWGGGGGGDDFGLVVVGDVVEGVLLGTGDDKDLAPQLQCVPPFPLLNPNEEEKGGETPIFISPPAPIVVGPEIIVAGNPAIMSIPSPSRGEMARPPSSPSSRSRPEKRDKEAGNRQPSSSSSSFFLSSFSWTRGRGNGCSPTGVCSGLVSGVVVKDEDPSLVSSFVIEGFDSVGAPLGTAS